MNNELIIRKYFQLTFIDEPPDPNISTFRPLDQMINNNIKYNGNGYMPCNGNLPCQVTRQTISLLGVLVVIFVLFLALAAPTRYQ